MLFPAVEPGSGPFPGRAHRWSVPEAELPDGQRAVAAAWYLALMTGVCLDLIGADGPVVVEGPLAANAQLAEMLAAIVPAGLVAASQASTGTSAGAALLALPPGEGPPGAAPPARGPAARPAARRLRRPLARRGHPRYLTIATLPHTGDAAMTVMTRSAPSSASIPPPLPGDLFIGGAWRPGATGKRIDVVDPSTGAVIASVADATRRRRAGRGRRRPRGAARPGPPPPRASARRSSAAASS